MMSGSAERRKVRLINRDYFPRIPTHVITIHQRYRRTEGQTTYHGNTALRYASRGKNDASRRMNGTRRWRLD